MASFSLERFPETESVKVDTGLLFSCTIQPFAKLDAVQQLQQLQRATPKLHEVLRCSSCFSYINHLCDVSPGSWTCSLCGKRNNIRQMWAARYASTSSKEQAKAPAPPLLPELQQQSYEMLVSEAGPIFASPQGEAQGPAPVFLALVDVSRGCDADFIELVRSGLLAALEALPPSTLFGLITFGDKVCLHDVKAGVPCARQVAIPPHTDAPAGGAHRSNLAVPLAEAMPLHALLAPVGPFKEAITAALEGLQPPERTPSLPAQPHTTSSSSSSSSGGAGSDPLANGVQQAQVSADQPPPQERDSDRRGFGAALFGVLEYLQAIKAPPFTLPQAAAPSAGPPPPRSHQQDAQPDTQSPVRLAVFLSGPPDYGIARLRGSPSQPSSGRSTQQQEQPQQQQQQQQQQQAPQPDAGPSNPRNAWMGHVDPAAATFYKQAAVAAAALGCCCDLYAVSPNAVGLSHLSPLPNSTGGAIFLYTSVEDSALPQDLYRRLSSPHASAGLLRIRTSQGFHAARFYGRLFPDPQIEDLHHVINASDSDTFAIDFEFGSSRADCNKQEAISAPPTVQVAFQYTVAVPMPPVYAIPGTAAAAAAAAAAADTHTAPGSQGAAAAAACMLQRRVRVSTYRAGVAGKALDVMRSCNPKTMLAVLLHKLMRVSALQGRARARLLLMDWLVELAANYHAALHAPPSPPKTPQQRAQHLLRFPVDVAFMDAPALHPLPRLVYALLRSPVLAPAVEGQHADLVGFLEHCWGCLTPAELCTAVYPSLAAYADPDTQVCASLPLSRSVLHPSPSSAGGAAPQAPPIFLLDAYIVILVLYSRTCPSAVPYPPPQQSALRRVIGAIRQERKIAPMVKVVREGSEDAQLFFHLLLDEPELPASPAGLAPAAAAQTGSSRQQQANAVGSSADARGAGLQSFLESVRLEVVNMLQ